MKHYFDFFSRNLSGKEQFPMSVNLTLRYCQGELQLESYVVELTHNIQCLFQLYQKFYCDQMGKVNSFRQLLEQLSSLNHQVVNIEINSVETRLLAFNTFLEASTCGVKGHSLSHVVDEVSDICLKSGCYLGEIKKNIDSTRQAIQSMIKIKSNAINNDMNAIFLAKSQIDTVLGKLFGFEELLSDILSSDLSLNSKKEHLKLGHQRLKQDLLCLSSIGESFLPVLSRVMGSITNTSNSQDSFLVRQSIEKIRQLLNVEAYLSVGDKK